ncbi:MAG: hypothetical protein V4489_04195 [Chlamydiota bacterium]
MTIPTVTNRDDMEYEFVDSFLKEEDQKVTVLVQNHLTNNTEEVSAIELREFRLNKETDPLVVEKRATPPLVNEHPSSLIEESSKKENENPEIVSPFHDKETIDKETHQALPPSSPTKCLGSCINAIVKRSLPKFK